ncbi:MAG: hypothetical protein HY722_16370, partial [Planctomycetes bacterium]|nr:hypothetical protein [Planctomycetota bacterium]
MNEDLVEVELAGYRWRMARAFEAAVREGIALRLEAVPADPAVTIIKDNRARAVYRVPLDGAGTFYLKRYRVRGWLERLKHLLVPSKAVAEWRAMRELARRGLPTAEAVAVAERRRGPLLEGAAFVATAIEPSRTLGRHLGTLDATGRHAHLRALADLAARLHRAGARHPDFHLGNVLAVPDADPPRLALVDLHAVSFPWGLGRRARLSSLAKLCEALVPAHPEDFRLVMETYHALEPGLAPDAASLAARVAREARRIRRRQVRSRSRRCLLESSRFTLERRGPLRIWRRRELGPDELLGLLARHEAALALGGPEVVARSRRAALTRLTREGGGAWCVKSFPSVNLLGCLPTLAGWSRGRRAWVAGNGLLVRGLPTPEPYARVEEGSLGFYRKGYLVTEFIDGAWPLHRYAAALPDGPARRRFVAWLAGEVRRLHESGARLHDLSAKNVLVRPDGEGWRLWFIDLDDVLLWRSATASSRRRNLVQLGHLPRGAATRTDRLRFWRAYAGVAGEAGGRGGWKALARAILEKERLYRERTGLED